MPDSTNNEERINAPANGNAFAFGKNWSRFLTTLNDDRVLAAENSLRTLLRVETLNGQRFLDAGSGSGLFSLAAYRMQANVVSFDVDRDSIACTQELKRRYASSSERWNVTIGSLLDESFLQSLGSFDVVYCWGVAHHTGDMWSAIHNLSQNVKPNGFFVLAIYNDQLYISKAWRGIKRIYNRLPPVLRPLFAAAVGSYAFLKRLIVTMLAALLRLITLRNPFVPLLNWARETQARGMHGWYDLVDWVGGWPFEVAKPEEIFRYLRDRQFMLKEMTTCIGHGCNEFVFQKTSPPG